MAGQENNNKCLLLLAIEIIRKELERSLLTKPAIRPFALMALNARSSDTLKRLVTEAAEQESSGDYLPQGDWHATKNFMGIIWTVLQGSGIEDSLSLLYGTATIKSIMNVHDYKKSLRALKLIYIYLFTEQLHAFVEENNADVQHRQHIVAQFEKSEQMNDQLLLECSDILTKYNEWRHRKLSSINFRFWDLILNDFISPLLSHVIAIRSGDYDARLEAWLCYTKYFFIFNHYKYAKMACSYIFELQTTSTYLKTNLKNLVSASVTGKPFTKLALDEAIECTINKESKSKSGISGRMDNDHLHGYYRSSCLSAKMLKTTEELLDIEHRGNELNIENTISRIKRDNDDLKKIFSSVKINPFLLKNDANFIRLSTGVIIPNDVVKELINATAIGEEQTVNFITKRIIEKSVKYNDRIPQNRIRTLSSWQQVPRVIKENPDKKKKINIFLSTIAIVKTHRVIDMNYIFKYEFTEQPLSLANENGMLYHPTGKSLLTSYFEELFPQHVHNGVFPITGQTHYLIDGYDLLSTTPPIKATTYEEYGKELMNNIVSLFDRMQRIDIVFSSDQQCQFTDFLTYSSLKSDVVKAVVRPEFKLTTQKPKAWQDFIASNEGTIAECCKKVSTIKTFIAKYEHP
ncbi:unnamed protein product [Didymodactylos carnosus]|uniref:Uncharacterized protein n=1 Tax=Didymodactylos carnosus TaxID=1234261 RepID=A0A8S2E234_9BILA|nr:unnamed protein product [Didymodactylos carnosus]CAF3816770.1 unnamed protein product [Didymodactylos carnosus]